MLIQMWYIGSEKIRLMAHNFILRACLVRIKGHHALKWGTTENKRWLQASSTGVTLEQVAW